MGQVFNQHSKEMSINMVKEKRVDNMVTGHKQLQETIHGLKKKLDKNLQDSDVGRDQSEIDYKGDISHSSVPTQPINSNVSPTTLQLYPVMHKSFETHFETTNKSEQNEILQKLGIDDIKHALENEAHKHHDIAFGENFADKKSQHNFIIIEIDHHSEEGDLLNPKANTAGSTASTMTDNGDIVSDMIEESMKIISLKTKSEGYQHQSTRENIAEPPSLRKTNPTDVEEAGSLRTDDGNIITQCNLVYSENIEIIAANNVKGIADLETFIIKATLNFRGRGTIREDQQASALNKRQDKRDALKTTVFPMECRHSYPHPVQTESALTML